MDSTCLFSSPREEHWESFLSDQYLPGWALAKGPSFPHKFGLPHQTNPNTWKYKFSLSFINQRQCYLKFFGFNMYNEKLIMKGVEGRAIWKQWEQNTEYASFIPFSVLIIHSMAWKTAYYFFGATWLHVNPLFELHTILIWNRMAFSPYSSGQLLILTACLFWICSCICQLLLFSCCLITCFFINLNKSFPRLKQN